MSRSYKKTAMLKQGDKEFRKIGNRKYRKQAKNALLKDAENMPLMNEVVDPYDINESKFMPSRDDKKWYDKAKRK